MSTKAEDVFQAMAGHWGLFFFDHSSRLKMKGICYGSERGLMVTDPKTGLATCVAVYRAKEDAERYLPTHGDYRVEPVFYPERCYWGKLWPEDEQL